MKQREQIRRLTVRTLLIVLVVLQDLIPMFGNIPLGPLSITTLPVTVAVVAVVLGPKEGTIIGFVWGLLTWIRAFVYPSSALAPLIFTNPLISVVPRMLIGLFAGYAFKWLVKILPKALSAGIAGLIAAATNTVLVLGGIYLFANTPAVAAGYHVASGHLAQALMVIVTTNGVTEAITTAILTPLIALPVMVAVKKGSTLLSTDREI